MHSSVIDIFPLCRDDAERLADKLKKISVADIVETMEVSVVPFSVHDGQTCSIYKLQMKLYKPEHYPKHTNISIEDWEETLEVAFVRELEDAIQNHLLLLSKISGIKDFVSGSVSKVADEADDETSGSGSQQKQQDDDDDADEEDVEDFGLDAQKQKQQATDEKDYDDNSEEEEGASSPGYRSEIDQAENDTDVDQNENDDAENEIEINKDEISESPSQQSKSSKSKSSKKNTKSKSKAKKVKGRLVKKETDRAIRVAAKGFHFEVHFKFTNEPHILLAQVILLLCSLASFYPFYLSVEQYTLYPSYHSLHEMLLSSMCR